MAKEQLFRRFEITCGEEQKEAILALWDKIPQTFDAEYAAMLCAVSRRTLLSSTM